MAYLREINRDDIQTINEWRNVHELIDCLGANFRYINQEVDLKWFDEYMKNRANTVRCAICEEDQLVGMVALTDINHINGDGLLHIMIGNANYQGKGIGYFAIVEMLKHAFLNLNLHRIELQVLESNKRAQSLYNKAGFKMEGIRRDSVYKNGYYQNLYIMSILREEFDEKYFKKN